MTKTLSKIIGSFRLASSVGLLAAAALTASSAQAAVSLSITGSGGSSISLKPGSTFGVAVKVTSTAESLTGVDYFLSISGAAAGKIRLTARDLTGSSFSDANLSNTGDNGSNPGVLDTNFSLLNPKNSLDLGATLSNISAALPPNTGANPASYLLANYTFSVDPTIAPGTYTLSTSSLAGSGVVTQAPNFTEMGFAQQGSFTVTVTPSVGGTPVPEPTGMMALMGMGGLALRRRRR